MLLRHTIAIALLGPACASNVGPPADGESSGASTSAASDGAPVVPNDGSSDADTGAASSTSTSSDPAPKFDVPATDIPPHTYTSCAASPMQIVDVEIETPSGPFVATHAWWGWNECCIMDPQLVLANAAELELVDGQIVTPHVVVLVPGTWESDDPFVGPHEVVLQDVGDGGFGERVDGTELLVPLDPLATQDEEQPEFSATFAIDALGWSIVGSVTAPFCAEVTTPPCPCE